MSSTVSGRHGGSIILGCIIIAVGMQMGHADNHEVPDNSKAVADIIGRPMYKKTLDAMREAVFEVMADPGDPNTLPYPDFKYIGSPLPDGAISTIVEDVTTAFKAHLVYYKVKTFTGQVWYGGNDPALGPKIPRARTDETLYTVLGKKMADDIVLRLKKRLTSQLETLDANNTTITIGVIGVVAQTTGEGGSIDFGCWRCIPFDEDTDKWYDTCNDVWGEVSL